MFPLWRQSRRLASGKAASKNLEVNTKKYDINLTNYLLSSRKLNPTEERIKNIQFTNSDEETIIDRFIIPIRSEKSIPEKEVETISPKLKYLLAAFHIDNDEVLPLTKPKHLKENPFEYHSKYNGDESYVSMPRLSVTKLLTSQWCELREFYTIYSGSPVKEETKEMRSGTEAHLKLELQTHKLIDTEEFSKLTDNCIEEKVVKAKKDISKLEDPNDIQQATTLLNNLIELLDGASPESSLASDWLEKIVSRLFYLINTSEAREVLLHGYLDLITSNFVSNLDEFPLRKHNHVLVSGVVDYLKLVNPYDENDLSMFKDIQDYMEFTYQKLGENRLIDLTSFLRDIEPIILEYRNKYKIVITDVKTRSWNKLPQQESVIQAAKLQASYYRNLFGILAGEFDESSLCYEMLIENAKRRNLDVDRPISLKSALLFLRAHHSIILKDYVKMANGEPIGFEPFDTFTREKYLNRSPSYDFRKLFSENEIIDFIQKLKETDSNDLNFEAILTPEFLKAWKVPLTLRYFAARSSQLYHLFKPFLSDLLSIEYHNAKTGKCFHTNYYTYDTEENRNASKNATAFWNGSKPPSPVNDLSKCTYCDFSSKCLIPNPEKNVLGSYGSVGSKIKNFIHS